MIKRMYTSWNAYPVEDDASRYIAVLNGKGIWEMEYDNSQLGTLGTPVMEKDLINVFVRLLRKEMWNRVYADFSAVSPGTDHFIAGMEKYEAFLRGKSYILGRGDHHVVVRFNRLGMDEKLDVYLKLYEALRAPADRG